MCRHVGYVGPAVPLSRLLYDPPHSLEHQSWAPADMRAGGTINADGFGVGWYPASGADPLRYRRDRPMWTDVGFAGLAATVRAGAMLGSVRSATVGMPVVETAAAPFTGGRWLFSHNGAIRGWPHAVSELAARLPVTDLMKLDAPTDAALLWALVWHRLRAGADMATAVEEVVLDVAEEAPGSRLNLMLTDGDAVVATTWTHSLSVCVASDAVTVASEPLDGDGDWRSVPDRHLVVARPSDVDIRPLG
jgi:glutamine amidotransferase